MSSTMWKYFNKVKNGASCKFCNAVVKTSGNTTNLKQHLKRKHPSLNFLKPTKSAKCSKFDIDTVAVEDEEGDEALFVKMLKLINIK